MTLDEAWNLKAINQRLNSLGFENAKLLSEISYLRDAMEQAKRCNTNPLVAVILDTALRYTNAERLTVRQESINEMLLSRSPEDTGP